VEERGGSGSPGLTWDQAGQLAVEALPFIRKRVGGKADRDDILQELTIRLKGRQLRDASLEAQKRYACKVAKSVIARHFGPKHEQMVRGVPVDPYIVQALAEQVPAGELPEYSSGSMEREADRLSTELHKRMSSLRAEAETCPVDRHRSQCPETVLQSVAGALAVAALRFADDLAGADHPSLLESRRKLRDDEVRRRIAKRGCTKKAAEKWVERVILPCFDWWIYRVIDGLDSFDAAKYERAHASGSEIWDSSLPTEWSAAQRIIKAVQVHRWMVLRHIKVVDGRWDAEKYGLKRMRVLLPAHPDLAVIIRIHMPAVAEALGLGGNKG